MPTAEEQVFTLGTDLTPTLGAGVALIEQAIELATTTSYRGLVIYSETTPATSGEPSGYPTGWYEWHKRCLWLKPSTGEVFRWNGTTWALGVSKPGTGTITGSMVSSATLEVSKLKPDAGSSLKLIRVNLGESAFEYVAAADAFAANSIPISKLDGTSSGSFVLTRSAGSKSWTLFDSATIISLFGANEFPIDYIERGSALQVPMVNSGGTAIAWSSVVAGIADGTLTLAKLQPVVADAGKYLRRNLTTGAVEAVTLSTPVTPNIQRSSFEVVTLPSAGAPTATAHTLSATPDVVHGCFVCTTIDQGYAIGDCVPLGAVKLDSGVGSADFSEAYLFSWDATNVVLHRANSAAAALIANKSTGTVGTFTPASWKFRFNAVRFY